MMLNDYDEISKNFDRFFSSEDILTLLSMFTLNNVYLSRGVTTHNTEDCGSRVLMIERSQK
jgi:hypothetical protein